MIKTLSTISLRLEKDIDNKVKKVSKLKNIDKSIVYR
jgi:hypothetical protein